MLNLSLRTVQRWVDEDDKVKRDQRKEAVRAASSNQLTDHEREQILEICNSERYKSLPPTQIVPTLADEGIYVASESSFYRVLRAAKQQHHRGRSQKPVRRQPSSHCAIAPNQVWSWDITYVNSTIRGKHYYLYMVLDIYSRKVVAWEVHAEESAEHASRMIQKACMQNKISLLESPLVLHSDNGSPMKGSTMLSTLQQLGVHTSFSRPRVSNDNPYSEAGFRTMKYRPDYPECFVSLDAARAWVHSFVQWYNHEHKHSGLKFQTPADRHSGLAEQKVFKRNDVYQQAKALHPERWGSRKTRDWQLPETVWLNPERSEHELQQKLAA